MFYVNVRQALYSSFPSLFSDGLRETLFTFLLLLLSARDTWGLFFLRGTTPARLGRTGSQYPLLVVKGDQKRHPGHTKDLKNGSGCCKPGNITGVSIM